MKALVVYYSLTGKTKLVSQVIAEELNATSASQSVFYHKKVGGSRPD